MKEHIENLKKRIDQCIMDECEAIRKTANPRKTMHEYVRNIRWTSPELAVYLEKTISETLNLDD